MEEKDLKVLRNYLRRKIAEKNSEFGGMSSRFMEESKLWRTVIFRNFAQGDAGKFSQTTGNINLQYIYEDISKNNKSISPYNYFDLDTLIAYDSYLGQIIECIEDSRKSDGRRYFMPKDFHEAIGRKVSKFFVKNAGTSETGYYNLSRTIVPLKDNNNKLIYERTPGKKAFENNYSEEDCNRLLQKYLSERHLEKFEIDEDMESMYESIEIYGKKFYITSTEVYLDANCSPIKYIVAVTEDNCTEIRGFLKLSGEIYYGDVYDTDGNFVYDRDQSGLAMFGESATNQFDSMRRE